MDDTSVAAESATKPTTSRMSEHELTDGDHEQPRGIAGSHAARAAGQRDPGASDGSLRLVGIRKRYGDVDAVSGLDLEVAAGEFLAVLGPSGSGKTTTLRIVGGFVAPDEGRVEVAGRDVTNLPASRRDVNTVFQSYALFPHMTVAANIEYGLKIKRVTRAERRRRVAEALALVQLEHAHGQRPGELSGGMQQRVALARALVNRPSILLLDEPLGALDRKLRDDMQLELRQVQAELGITFMYVTHDQDEALGMSDRLVVMRDGRIEQSGPPAEVYDNPVSLWVAGFVGASNRLNGTVRTVGELVEIETDVGPISARHRHGPLRSGAFATAIVRPEHVTISDAAPESPVNAVRARLHQILNVGSQLRCVAFTAGGVEFSIRRARLHADATLEPAQEVWLSWSADAVHAYVADGPGASAPAPG